MSSPTAGRGRIASTSRICCAAPTARRGKVKKETLANLSHLPDELIELIRGALAGRRYLDSEAAFAIERSLPAGHVGAALAMARRLELGRLLDRAPGRERDLCLAMICQQTLAPGSKLATVRALSQSTLGDELAVVGADEDELYGALDWLLERQVRIEDRLARRHLTNGELVLYDVSSSYFEGRSCPLAKLGYSRDGRRGTPQIVYGLLCDPPRRPADRRRGLQRPAARRQDAALPDREAHDALRAGQGRGRVRSRDGHQGQPRAHAPDRRDRLDHRAQGPADQKARAYRGAAAVAV